MLLPNTTEEKKHANVLHPLALDREGDSGVVISIPPHLDTQLVQVRDQIA